MESSGGGQVEKSRWRVQAENPGGESRWRIQAENPGGESRWRIQVENPGGEEPEKRSGQAEEASMSLRRRCRLATVRSLVYE